MTDWLLMLAVSAGGALGSVLRYLVSQLAVSRTQQFLPFPWATGAVNLLGSLALGLLAGPLLAIPWGAAVTAGLLGGFTTFSTASLETVQLLRARRLLAATGYGVSMLVGCTLLSLAGLALTS